MGNVIDMSSWLTGSGPGYPYWLGLNPPPNPYASIHSDTTQKVTAANQETIINTWTANPSYNITINGNQIVFPIPGTYRFSYSVQLATVSGGVNTAYLYLKKNGTAIANSANYTSLPNNGATDAAFADIITLNAGDYMQLCLYSADSNMAATAYPATGPVPASPCIAVEINKIA